MLQIILGLLNLTGGAVSLIKLYLPMLREDSTPGSAPDIVPSNVKKLTAIQTTLNCVQIAFGISMLVPGVVPGLLMAGILVNNGLLLFILASVLLRLDDNAHRVALLRA